MHEVVRKKTGGRFKHLTANVFDQVAPLVLCSWLAEF